MMFYVCDFGKLKNENFESYFRDVTLEFYSLRMPDLAFLPNPCLVVDLR